MNAKASLAISAVVLFSCLNIAQAKKNYPKIYPFIPMSVESIYSDIEKVTEDKNFIKNFNDIIRLKLSHKRTKVQPWSSSYWPLAKGGIADPYENARIPYYTDFLKTHKRQWRSSYGKFLGRKNLLKKIDTFTSGQLTQLAPSEKYDLLMGDKTFDLTNRLMEYMNTYGKDNYYGSFSKILAAGEDTAFLAQLYVEKNYYKNIEEALTKDIVLSRRLEAQNALKLLSSGGYSDPIKAIMVSTPKALEEARNYVVDEPLVQNIAAWEGICNGWSTAAGIIPRPRKAVSFTLPSGKELKFFPEDIKGLIALYWFNSFIQKDLKRDKVGKIKSGGSMNVGLRCSQKKIKKDEFGRFYDTQIDPFSKKLEPRCVGVHPAKWHLGLVNIIGKQGRSFIVERKVKSPVDNHPMSSYSMKYFNPNTGRKRNRIEENIVPIGKKDQFLSFRHPKAKYIVGVETKMVYLDYLKPIRRNINSEAGDEKVSKRMFYDLELDADYNIVGGQWRSIKVGKPPRHRRASGTSLKNRLNHNQPDFFWAISKDWKKTRLFDNDTDVTAEWKDSSKAPPASWLKVAKNYHSFKRIDSTYFGTGKECITKNKVTGEKKTMWCELATNTPQPLSNVINKLIELSSGVKFKDIK